MTATAMSEAEATQSCRSCAEWREDKHNHRSGRCVADVVLPDWAVLADSDAWTRVPDTWGTSCPLWKGKQP